MEKSIKDEGLNDLLREIDSAEAKCLEALKRLRKQRLELTGEDLIEFTVSTIHKDRIGLVLTKVMKVDRTQSYNKLKDQWRASAKAKDGWWLGEVSLDHFCSWHGPRLVSCSTAQVITRTHSPLHARPSHSSQTTGGITFGLPM